MFFRWTFIMSAFFWNPWVMLLRGVRLFTAISSGRARLKPDGTRWRTVGEVKGETCEWSGWRVVLHSTSKHGVSNITNITTADAHSSAASSRLNLNGLVRFAERQKMVSARVPSCFKRAVLWELSRTLCTVLRRPIPVAARSLACCDCGFESRWSHGCLSPVNVFFFL